MISDIEDFFAKGCGRCERFSTARCSTRLWADGLAQLRQICLLEGLVETVKWGHPCYMHAGRNVVILGALREDFRLSFFHAALMIDPDGVLERQGPNTRHPDMIRFTADAQVAAREATIRALLRQAMDHAARGTRPPAEPQALELPADLRSALAADGELAEAFAALTPGRQRSHVIALTALKRPESRARRITALRPHILAGKGATER